MKKLALALIIVFILTSLGQPALAGYIKGWGDMAIDSNAVVAGGGHSLALKSDGSIVGRDFISVRSIDEGVGYPQSNSTELNPKYSGGAGDANDPYQIATVVDLLALAADTNDYNKCFILTADIDLDPNLPGGRTFTTAIIAPNHSGNGFQGTAFSGIFDGAGHKITNLTINTDFGCYLGLFGYISGGEIKNLGIDNASIYSGGDYPYRNGGLAGYNKGNISNCHFTGSVTCGDILGGLVGENEGGAISNCYSAGIVTCDDYSHHLGGLVGENNGGAISNCYSTSDVIIVVGPHSASSYLGGLVGGNYNNGSISDCYATGVVVGGSGSQYLGGLVGWSDGGVGGCYFLITSGPANGYGTPLTDVQMKQQSSYVGWNFIWVWFIDESVSYPQLNPTEVNPKYSGGSGTAGDPYQIATVADLLALAANKGDYGKHFVLTADIDLDPNLPGNQIFTTAVIAAQDWPSFTGVFDGAGHKITNLTIDTNGAGNDYLGLFGYVVGGEIKNLGLENVSVTGSYKSYYLGGLVGQIEQGNINNCHSTGDIIGGDESLFLGGLVGENRYGDVINCYSAGTVLGGYDSFVLGGLVGSNYGNGGIIGCYATGDITSGENSGSMGGLVGWNDQGNISNCYSTGNVTVGEISESIGGLVGYSGGGSISNCYSTGNVAGGSDIGGLVGWSDGSIIRSCYFLDVAGPNNGFGTPLTDEQMKQQASFVGWDFNDVWHICETTNYPKLIWQIPLADFVCPDGVNFADYGFFANWWGAENCAANNNCDGADLTGDGRVDADDMAALADYWLTGF